MALTSGTRLGPYEIQSPLGSGGMGEVYRARDTRLDRTVAVKVLASHLSSSPELKQRMEREARAISSLNHPNICTLHDIGSQDGTNYLVMEYLEGETLDARLQRGPLPLKQVLECGMQVCDALATAHRAGIVHRDLGSATATEPSSSGGSRRRSEWRPSSTPSRLSCNAVSIIARPRSVLGFAELCWVTTNTTLSQVIRDSCASLAVASAGCGAPCWCVAVNALR